MRIRHRRSRRLGRVGKLMLSARTAVWLSKLLWRPTLLELIGRTRRTIARR